MKKKDEIKRQKALIEAYQDLWNIAFDANQKDPLLRYKISRILVHIKWCQNRLKMYSQK
jgi:hypothetical protein